MSSPVGENLNNHVFSDMAGNLLLPKATKIVLADGSEITSEDSAVNVLPEGTADEIDVDDADAAAPVFSLAAAAKASLALADSSQQKLPNDLAYADLEIAHPAATVGAGQTAWTTDKGGVVSNGTIYVLMATGLAPA